MNDRSKAIIYEEQVFSVGLDTFIGSTAENNNVVICEDNMKQEIDFKEFISYTSKVKSLYIF
ncbi:hypothetical protein EDF66_105345 [Sphingobacterium sp. JUb20]|nr:hypothetical protein [Sphingobacterium sp. JUb21]TCR07712.1 hypothetical protein EDF66_105345 [Sphingobacterium sp. JUb20]